MGLKFWAVLLVLSLAVAAESSPHSFGFIGAGDLTVSVGDSMDAFEEMMMDSEANRRQLAGNRRYISYGALKKNTVPCNRRGQSYYNCNKMKRANPYKRGCSAITHCKRITD
ncbi:protein RALF-like 19 [Rhodamnia argentea]|uniref:Protein RALF-like 19 n=1 Tax=Rhodamnia argentea TaxID=178133 RepID=A0A8B8P1X9_9MYRT|nr:protein RALF-like 19 [Rhodamnia argentea]